MSNYDTYQDNFKMSNQVDLKSSTAGLTITLNFNEGIGVNNFSYDGIYYNKIRHKEDNKLAQIIFRCKQNEDFTDKIFNEFVASLHNKVIPDLHIIYSAHTIWYGPIHSITTYDGIKINGEYVNFPEFNSKVDKFEILNLINPEYEHGEY